MKSLKELQKLANKLRIRITKKSKYKRIYKTRKQLSKEIKMKNKKLKFGEKRKIRFSEDTKENGNHKVIQTKRQVSESRKQKVKELLENSELREKQARNEAKINQLIASVLSEYNIDNNIEFYLLNELIDIYKSSKIDNMKYFDRIQLKYYSQAPHDKKPEIIKIFNHLKPLIELIVEIRNS